MTRMRLPVVVLLVLLLFPCGALSAGIVFLVRTGTDAQGNPQFRTASASDTGLEGLSEVVQGSSAVQEAARYHEVVQQSRTSATLQAQGLSAAEVTAALASTRTDPVYIEVNNSCSGSYNAWDGSFTVVAADGTTSTISGPRVVVALGSDAMVSNDRSLIEQTLVHEIAHGVMAKAFGSENLPTSPNLGQAHSGGSTTDQGLAYIEGWAEFVGAYFTGRTTIANDPSGAITSNWYASSGDGTTKSSSALLCTEGWSATVLYEISTKASDSNALWKLTDVMARTKAQSMMELLAQAERLYPELTATIDQVLENTSSGQIVSPSSTSSSQATAGTGDGTGSEASEDLWDEIAGGDSYESTQGRWGLSSRWSVRGNRSGGAARADREVRMLGSLLARKQQELDSLPWYSFFKRIRLKRELSSLQAQYQEQLSLRQSILAQGGGDSSFSSTEGTGTGDETVSPAGPRASRTAYQRVLSAVSSQNLGAAREALEAYGRSQAQDRARRVQGR